MSNGSPALMKPLDIYVAQCSPISQQKNSSGSNTATVLFKKFILTRMSAAKLMFICAAVLVLATTMTVTGEPCEDAKLWAKDCINLKRNFGERICTSRNRHMRWIARKKCRRTCGICPQGSRRKAQAPPMKCSRTLHGCCWDRFTAAAGPRDLGCPPCADRHRSACQVFRWMCGRNTNNADYIKFSCPVTCGFCNPNTYIATGKEESLQTIITRMRRKEYNERKSRKG